MKYSEFLEQNGNLLVKVNPDEDVETGWFRLLETEKSIAWDYLQKGYKVFTIGEDPNNEEEELVTKGYLDNVYVTGYFVCFN